MKPVGKILPGIPVISLDPRPPATAAPGLANVASPGHGPSGSRPAEIRLTEINGGMCGQVGGYPVRAPELGLRSRQAFAFEIASTTIARGTGGWMRVAVVKEREFGRYRYRYCKDHITR